MNSPTEMLLRRRNLATHRIHTLPIVVLMPHQGCNCRCEMCDLWRSGGNGSDLSQEDIAAQIEGMRRLRVRRVVLSGGEALLCGELWGMCDLLKSIPARITLLSNGLLLRQHAREIVRSCDQVVVSLDGSPQTHDTIRGVPGAFDRLAEGVASLKALDPDLRVTARCVIQRRNFRELPEIVGVAHRIGLDQISFLAVDVSTTAFARSSPWSADRARASALDTGEVGEFAAIVDGTIRDRAGDLAPAFIAESPDRLRRLVSYFAALNGDVAFPPTICNAPWTSAVVEADGTVRPCFFHGPLGNLHDGPLESILNSPAAIDFRTKLNPRRDPVCGRCVCTLSVGPRTVV